MKIDYSDVNNLIKLAKQVHGEKYDYSLLTPTSNREKVTIICPELGPFEQRIYMHIYRKQGCPKCEGYNMNTDEFIKLSKKVHNNKYSYSNSIFKGKRKNVIITCDKHGDFSQRAYSHIMGAGVPLLCWMC